MFLGIMDNLKSSIEKVAELIQSGLGPLAKISELGNKDVLLSFVTDFGVQIAATAILFIVVAVFLWKPITNILEKRREAIDKELEEANVAKANAIEVERQLNDELSNAKQRVKEMLDQAEKEANIKRDAIISQAREDAKHRMESLEVELEQEKKSMEKEIRQQIIDIAFEAAEKIVAKEVNRDKYIEIVDDILKGANE